jgi:membrane fusion protein (multidrug efflux system)
MARDAQIKERGEPSPQVPAVTPFPGRPESPAPSGPTPIPAAQAPMTPKTGRRKLILGGIALAILVGAGTYGYDWWTTGRFMVRTDDAYVQADIAAIAPKIQGYIEAIPVIENQRIAAGDVIARLDDGDYRIALSTAESRVESQRATLARIEAQVKAAEAAVGEARAQKLSADALLHNADLTATRQRALVAGRSVPQAKLDDAEAALQQAQAASNGAEAQIASAEANVAVLHAQYDEAASQIQALTLAVDQARRNLDLTILRAPYAGVVANLAVEQGDLVSPGQRLAAIVPVDELYIEANYKETQLADIAPGALVHVSVDALPSAEFEGRVASVAPATGALFSILPPSNATGNFTKVVQRVPVRIDLPPEMLADGRLRAGLSVVVEVDSRTPGSQ